MRYDYKKPAVEKKLNQHPIWRGIGFLIMVIIPFVSFGLSEIILENLAANVSGFSIPSQLRSGPYVVLEDWVIMDLWAVIALAILLMFFLLSLFAMINTLIFGMTRNKNRDIFESDKKDFKKKTKKY